MLGFMILAVLSLGSAIGVIVSRHPVHSALFLVGNIITLALFYFALSAEYMGAAQVIVYAGAIMVLFLFVVTLLTANKAALELPEELPGQRLVGGLLSAAIGVALIVYVRTALPPGPGPVPAKFGGLVAMGQALWGPYFVYLVAVAIMLLTAGIGVLVLNRTYLPTLSAGSGNEGQEIGSEGGTSHAD